MADIVEIAAGRTLTLDLNGCVITADDGGTQYISNAGTLVIKDSSTAGTGGISILGSASSGVRAQCLYNTGSLTVEGGTLSAASNTGNVSTVYSDGGVVYIRNGNLIVLRKCRLEQEPGTLLCPPQGTCPQSKPGSATSPTTYSHSVSFN